MSNGLTFINFRITDTRKDGEGTRVRVVADCVESGKQAYSEIMLYPDSSRDPIEVAKQRFARMTPPRAA